MTQEEIKKIYCITKYGELYIKIIQNANSEHRKKRKKESNLYCYYESHHILPKSIFKEFSSFKYNPWNKVLLTAREHFIVHVLLVKHYKKLDFFSDNSIKMSLAIQKMNNDGKVTNSKLFELLKLNQVKTLEHREKISASIKKLWENREYREKQIKSHKGNPVTSEHRNNISKALKGTKKPKGFRVGIRHSDEGKHNMSMAAKNRPKVTCTYCNKIGQKSAMSRWHFENCKMKY